MERIFTELSNPVWWFSVVLAGIVINILSSYLRGALDRFLSKSFSWWRNRSEARRKAWEELIKRIVSNRKEREALIADELRTKLKSIYYLLASFIFLLDQFIGPNTSFVLFSAIFLYSFFTWKKADDIEVILKEVEDRLSIQILEEEIKEAINILDSDV